jgi:hypothetical protein
MEVDMRRTLCVAALVIACAASATAQGAPIGDATFVGRIDLRVGIARLAEIAKAGDAEALAQVAGDGALLLFGTLSKPSVESTEPFEALAEFLEGEWVGTSSIVLHRVFLVFRGEAYREFLESSSGRRTVVIARGASIRAAKDGTRDVYLNVIAVRPIF